MAGRRVHFVFPEELVLRVDARLGPGQSRGEFVRGAVEQALEGQQKRGNAREAEERDVVNREPSAPAEQPEKPSRDEAHWRPGSSEERLLGLNVRSAREFRPYPKGGG